MLCVVGFFMMVHLATNKAFMINNKLSTCIRFHSKLAAPATSLFRCEEVLPSISVSGEQNITSTLKEIKFTVFGEPLALARHRMTKRGFNYNPSSKFQEMFLNACLPHLPSTPLDGPLDMKMIFHLKRPKTHYRSGKYSHILKEGAELYHSKKSDIDNLAKFVLDSLNEKAYLDDAQIAILSCTKLYTNTEARIEVAIRQLQHNTTSSSEETLV